MQDVSKTAAVAAFVLAAAACGSSSSTTGGTGAGSTTTSSGTPSSSAGAGGSAPTIAEACAAQAHATCTERGMCSLSGFENDLDYGSEAICETQMALTCATSLMAKGTGQTPARVEQCVAAFGSYTCAAFWDDDPSGPCVPPAGTLANGTACGASGQCSSTFCALGPYAVCGTCQPLPAAGAACQSAGDCGRNLACVKAAGGTAQDVGKCAAYVAMGDACLTDTDPCEAGLSCVGEDAVAKPPTMGKCQPSVTAVGDACDATRKTMATCDAEDGLVCIPTSATSKGVGTCKAIELVAAGMPCGDIGAKPVTGLAACEAGGACIKATALAATGTCKAPAAAGAACDSAITVGPPCLAPAKCVPDGDGGTAGTCVVPDATKCN